MWKWRKKQKDKEITHRQEADKRKGKKRIDKERRSGMEREGNAAGMCGMNEDRRVRVQRGNVKWAMMKTGRVH